MNLIGLDVGFSARRLSSGVVRLKSGDLSLGCASALWESRKAICGMDEVDVAAIDAPILPRESFDERPCERLFTLGCFQRRCKPGLSHVPGTGRQFRQAGQESARQLSEITSKRALTVKFPRVWGAHNLVEAFPNAFMGVLLSEGCYERIPKLRRGRKFEWLYDECREQNIFNSVIDTIGVAALPSVLHYIKSNQNHDQKAALICLLTAAGVAAGRYTAAGDLEGGYFFLPPWELWSSWARQELEIQRRRVESVVVWINGVHFPPSEPLPSAA